MSFNVEKYVYNVKTVSSIKNGAKTGACIIY